MNKEIGIGVFIGCIVVGCLIWFVSCFVSANKCSELLEFQPREQVCYVDDPSLIGRVLRRNGYCQYIVKWRVTHESVSGSIFGSSSHSKPFYIGRHKAWELVSVNSK